MTGTTSDDSGHPGIGARYLARLSNVLEIVLVASVAVLALRGSWQAAAATFGTALLTAVPGVLGRRLDMQKSGLMDTMGDLIVSVIGAALIPVLGYGWLKTEAVASLLERCIQRSMASPLDGGRDSEG